MQGLLPAETGCPEIAKKFSKHIKWVILWEESSPEEPDTLNGATVASEFQMSVAALETADIMLPSVVIFISWAFEQNW